MSEGRRLSAYQCSADVWTIGDGIASTSGMQCRGVVNGEFYKGIVCKGLTITADEADRLFDLHLGDIEQRISELADQELTQGQFDALASWVYNFGISAFIGSTLRKKINLNPNNTSIPAEFMRWINAAGKPEPGLYMRRAREAVTYLGMTVPTWMHQKSKWGFPDPFSPSRAIQIEEIASLVRAGEEPAKPPQPDPEPHTPEAEEVVRAPAPPPSPPKIPAAATPPFNPVGTKPPSIYTVSADKIPYKVDPNAGAKPLEESDRGKGFVAQEIGRGVIRFGSLGGFGVGSTTFKLLEDPIVSGVVLMLAAVAVGKFIELYGDWKRKRGEEAASQLLY